MQPAESSPPLSARALLIRARRDNRNQLLAYLSMCLPLLLVLAVSLAVTPDDIDSGRVKLTQCLSVRLLGRTCPSCGMTRAFVALSHGQLERAYRHNRGAGLFYGLFWLLAVAGGIGAFRSELQRRQLSGKG